MTAALQGSIRQLFLSRVAIFFVAFSLSFVWVVAGHTYVVTSLENHFFFGWEMGRIGASVASGQGFSSPLPLPTGPTAFAPPVYPLLIALIFKLFGIYNTNSALVLLALNCVFSGLTAVVLRDLGLLLLHEAAGALAGWAWAFYPYAAYANSHDIWDTCLTTLLLTVMLYVAYRMRQARTDIAWAGFGALCAITTLTSSSVVLVMAALWGWLGWRRWRQGMAWLKPAVLTLAGFVLLMAPWWVRNYEVMGRFIPLRTNFWLQAWLGNCRDGVLPNHGKPEDYFANVDYHNPIYWEHDKMMPNSEDPSAQRRQYQEFARLGELTYMEEKREAALHCIAADPARFAEFTGRRFIYTWTGALYLDIAGGHPALQRIWEAGYTALSLLAFAGLAVLWKSELDLGVPFALVLLVYPGIYYLTHVLIRYRYPIDPTLFLLAAVAAHSGYRRVFGSESEPGSSTSRRGSFVLATVRNLAQKVFLSRIAVFVWTFSISFVFIVAVRAYVLPAADNHFGFGYEMGRIAASVVSGNGYSSPMPLPTGPTAHASPLYPLLIALVFKLFGIYTAKSAMVLLFLNCVLSGMTAIAIRELGSLLSSDWAGALAGWAWAVYPYTIWTNARHIWETALTALLLTTMVLLAYKLGPRSSVAAWSGFGALCAAATLSSSTVIIAVVILWGWLGWQFSRQGSGWLKPVGTAVLGFVVLMSPWWIRNFEVFGRFIPFRSNLWLEVWVGNCFDDVSGTKPEDFFERVDYGEVVLGAKERVFAGYEHPSDRRMECAEWARLGEVNYMAEKRAAALSCIARQPRGFLELTGRRIVYTWTTALYVDLFRKNPMIQTGWMVGYSTLSILALAGLIVLWKRDKERAVPLALILCLFPVVYYVTHPQIRYRYSIDPEIILLAAVAISSGIQWLSTKPGEARSPAG